MIADVLRRIAACRRFPSTRLLSLCYGSVAESLRAECVSMLLGRKIAKSAKEAQWNNFRDILVQAVGATGECIAEADADFEAKAEVILRQPR